MASNTSKKTISLADEKFSVGLFTNGSDIAIKYGATGSAVREMQQMLIKLGFDCGSTKDDGIFGPNTKNGVKTFQSAVGLKATGEYTIDTKNHLTNAVKVANGATWDGKTYKEATTVYIDMSSTDYQVKTSNEDKKTNIVTLVDNITKNKGLDEIKQMQKWLIKLGFSCGSTGANGRFNADTADALKKFRTAVGITNTSTSMIYTLEDQKYLQNAVKIANGGVWDGKTYSEHVTERKAEEAKKTLVKLSDTKIRVTGEDGKKYVITFTTGIPSKISGIGKIEEIYTTAFSSNQISILQNYAAKVNNTAKNEAASKKFKKNYESWVKNHKTYSATDTNMVHYQTNASQNALIYPVAEYDNDFGIWSMVQADNEIINYTPINNDPNAQSSNTAQRAADAAISNIESVPNLDEPVDVPMASSVPATQNQTPSNESSPDEIYQEYSNTRKATIPITVGSKGEINETQLIKGFKPLIPEGNNESYRSFYSDAAMLNGKTVDGPRKKILEGIGLTEGTSQELLSLTAKKYNRFKMSVPDEILQKSFAHVFFVKPDCNIIPSQYTPTDTTAGERANEKIFAYAANSSPEIIRDLTSRDRNTDSDFSFILSNAAASFSLSDEYINAADYGQSWTGYKIAFGRNDSDSKIAGKFVVSFNDDKRLNIYKLIRCWVEYISGVYRGVYLPKVETINDHIMDYAGAVYYILTAEDGETIIFWSKYYGVFPLTIPSSQYSWARGTLLSNPSMDVEFMFSFKEDYNYDTIIEFNHNAWVPEDARNDITNYAYEQTYNPNLGTAGKTWVDIPFIETCRDAAGRNTFKLRFKRV